MSKYSEKRAARQAAEDASQEAVRFAAVGLFHREPMREGATSIRIKGQTLALLVGHDPQSGQTKTALVQMYPPFIDGGRVSRPGTLTTTGLFRGECQWCGVMVHTGSSLVRLVSHRKDWKRGGGVKAALPLVTNCPDCGKPLKSGFAKVTPSDPDAAAVLGIDGDPEEGKAWVDACVEKAKSLDVDTAPSFDPPACFGLWPSSLGYDTRYPYTQVEACKTAAEHAKAAVVETKGGKTISGLTLLDSEQLPPDGVVPPCGWYAAWPNDMVFKVPVVDDTARVSYGRKDDNFRVDLKIMFSRHGELGSAPLFTLGKILDGLVI